MHFQEINYNALKYRRQYVITHTGARIPFKHISVRLSDNYVLYYQPHLNYTSIRNDRRRIILLGDIFDFENIEWSNQRILEHLKGFSFPDLLFKTVQYAGRFIMILIDRGNIFLFTDASASRKLYYTRVKGRVSCSSNPHLLAGISGKKPSHNPSVIAYYNSDNFRMNQYANVGDRTYYDGIKQLIPNHYLELNTAAMERFWPMEIPSMSDQQIAVEAAKRIKGFLEAASFRYPVMLPLTAGYDSRILLAASKDISNKVFYYLNVTGNQNSPDAVFHEKILKRFGLEPHLLEIVENSDEIFSEIYFTNNPLANPGFVGVFYNYLLHFPEKVNLPGDLIPIVKSLYDTKKTINARVLAGLHNLDIYPFAIDYYNEWLDSLEDLPETIHILDLLYWEDIFPNSQTQLSTDKDIAQEEFVAFNSAYLISLMLSYSRERRKKPYLQLHKDIIRYLWPELLDFRFNPNLKNSIMNVLIKTGTYNSVKSVKRLVFK